MFILHTDGGSRQNPGPSGYGWVLHRRSQVVAYGRGFLGTRTNNQAEYEGLIHALKYLRDENITGPVLIRLDSKLVIGHQFQDWNCGPELRDLYEEAKALLSGMNFTMEWCPRLSNQAADQLVNMAINARDAHTVVRARTGGLGPYDPLAVQLRHKHYASLPDDRHLTEAT